MKHMCVCMYIYIHTHTYIYICVCAQSLPTLFDPMNWSPLGSSAHGDSPGKNTGVDCRSLLQGIFPTQGLSPGLPHWRRISYCLNHQASPRVLEWVAYPFSRELPNPAIKPRPLTLQVDSFFFFKFNSVIILFFSIFYFIFYFFFYFTILYWFCHAST